MDWTSLTSWEWMTLALTAFMVPCYVFVLVRHLRQPGSSPLLGGGRVAAVLWVAGLSVMLLGSTLPLGDAVEDVLVVVGLVMVLGAIVSEWLRCRGGATQDAG